MLSAPAPDPAASEDLLERVAALEAQLLEANRELAEFRRRPKVGLVWEDQREAVEDRMATELPVLVADAGKAVGEDAPRPHLLIEGDNLHALATMQYTHAGKVDVIYIDPPYNTGNKDFRYNDRYVDPEDEWRHSKWLAFMDRRIRLARELLAPGGFLAVSIDDNEMAHLKLLLDQHFGEGNVKTIVVKMSELAGVKMAAVKNSGTIAKLKEYLLIARPGGVRDMQLDPVPKSNWDTAYNQYLVGLTPQLRERIRSLRAQPEVSDEQVQALEQELKGVRLEPAKKQAKQQGVDTRDPHAYEQWCRSNAWRLAQSTNGGGSVMALVKDRDTRGELPKQQVATVRTARGLLYLALTKNARTLLLADDYLTTTPGDLWTDISTTSLSGEGGVAFSNGKKPLALLHRIIKAHPNRDVIVLDFFAGSGSTGHAVAELNAADGGNRQAILVTNNEGNICTDVTWPRMQGVLTGALPNGRTVPALPGTLRYYRCDFVPVTRNRDAMLRRLAGHTADLIAIRENTHARTGHEPGRWQALTDTDERTAIVWCDWTTDGLDEVLAAHGDAADRALYLFSFDEHPAPDIVAAHPDWRIEALPEPIRAALERAHRRSRR